MRRTVKLGRNNKRVKTPNDFLLPYLIRETLKNSNTMFNRADIRLKPFVYIVIQRYLEVVMNAPFIQFREIWNKWFWILGPKTTAFVFTKDIYIGF